MGVWLSVATLTASPTPTESSDNRPVVSPVGPNDQPGDNHWSQGAPKRFVGALVGGLVGMSVLPLLALAAGTEELAEVSSADITEEHVADDGQDIEPKP